MRFSALGAAWLAAASLVSPSTARAGGQVPNPFGTGPWGARPRGDSCSQAALAEALSSSRRQILRLEQGRSAEGSSVAGSVFRQNHCDPDSGWCTPLPEDPERFDPYVDPKIADPCVAFCVRVHEWRHFSDDRSWSLRWTSEELGRFWELPAYRAGAGCLESFLAPRVSLDPALLAPPRF